jgi:ABC-type sugar transport system permease subunit
MLRTSRLTPYFYIGPLVLLLGFVYAYPMVKIVEFSMRRIRGFNGPFIGLDNYRTLFKDPTFLLAVKHNIILLLGVPVLVISALVLGYLLYERPRGWRIYRTGLFIPYILSVPVVAVAFSYIFQLNGLLNTGLKAVGLDYLALDWLGKSRYALWTVMFVIIWRELSLGIVLFLARLMSVSQDIFDAAKIDGANWLQTLWYITIPQVRGVIEFYGVISTITLLAWVFAYVYVLTRGGPGQSTVITELYLFNYVTRNALPGIASAVAVLMLLGTFSLMVVLNRVRQEVGEAAYA